MESPNPAPKIISIRKFIQAVEKLLEKGNISAEEISDLFDQLEDPVIIRLAEIEQEKNYNEEMPFDRKTHTAREYFKINPTYKRPSSLRSMLARLSQLPPRYFKLEKISAEQKGLKARLKDLLRR